MLARDIMTRNVVTCSPDTTIEEAIKLLVSIEISGLIVLDQNNDIVGVITEKDLLIAYDFLKVLTAPVKDFYNKNVVSVTEETPIEEIYRILVLKNIRRVPVVGNKKLVGVVSRRDILKAILKHKTV